MSERQRRKRILELTHDLERCRAYRKARWGSHYSRVLRAREKQLLSAIDHHMNKI